MYLLDVFLNMSGDAAANPANFFKYFFNVKARNPLQRRSRGRPKGPCLTCDTGAQDVLHAERYSLSDQVQGVC